MDQKVLVFDLGGERLDITLIKVIQFNKEISIKTLAVDGDSHLGGSNWDDVIQQLLLNKFEDEYGIMADDELKREIRIASESIKIKLTYKECARKKIIYGGEYYTLNVSKEEFECATAHLNNHAITRIDSILETVKMSDEDINVVLAIGGTTQMPMIHNLLIERFGNKVVFENPMSTVLGAALVADMIQRNENLPYEIADEDDLQKYRFKMENIWDTEQIIKKLRCMIQQNIAQLYYNQSMDRIMISYEDDKEEIEMLDIFNEIMTRKKMYLNTRRQIKELMGDYEELISDRNQVKTLRVKLKNMEANRKQIEELIQYRLMSILSGLFLNSSSMEELDRLLNEYIVNQNKIKEIVIRLRCSECGIANKT